MREGAQPDRPYTHSSLFARYYLDERIQGRSAWDCDEAATEAMERLQVLFDSESKSAPDDECAVENVVPEILDVLGFETTVETTVSNGDDAVDFLLDDDTDTGLWDSDSSSDTGKRIDSEGPPPLENAIAIVQTCQRDAIDTAQNDGRPVDRVAANGIASTLERTPESVRWGILTNGRTWRLYGSTEVIMQTGGINKYETQARYEVDLPDLLERDDGEAFKYFYVFFRAAAFRESSGTTVLESIRAESWAVARELGTDLEESCFTALELLGRGINERCDPGIDPDDDERLEELKSQSLVLLYRLLVVMYAESRGLVGAAYSDGDETNEPPVSLDVLRFEIYDEIGAGGDGFAEHYDERSTTLWQRLDGLFQAIYEGGEALSVPSTDSGLFDRSEHECLPTSAICDRYLAEAIYRLSTTETGKGRHVPIDYADLDTRHLGNGYEALLERQFRIAPTKYAAVPGDDGPVWKPAIDVPESDAIETVDKGELYVVTDDGERKTSGTYYTPDEVVNYVVEKTVGPLVNEIEDELTSQGLRPTTEEYLDAFYHRVTDLTILDPAMGTGHFLTRATAYLASRVVSEHRTLEGTTAVDERRIRRAIVSECIYGVDRNEMAVELAKLSVWLEATAADQPTPFRDHNLRTGNSLVGSDVTEVLSAETLASIASTAACDEICRSESPFRRLFELADVHTAAQFDHEIPDGVHTRLEQAIDDGTWAELRTAEWFRRAQTVSDEKTFFHWELEFPDVFLTENGRAQERAGFDAVIGNPPWVATAGRGAISATMDRSLRAYLEDEYATTRQQFDLYVAFYEQFVRLAADGRTGIVVPDAILTREQNVHIRRYLLDNTAIAYILHLGTAFDTVENGAAVLVTGSSDDSINCAFADGATAVSSAEYDEIPQSVFREQDEHRFLLHLDRTTRSILETMDAHRRLGDRVSISRGEEIGKRAAVLSETKSQAESKAIIPGSAIKPYGFDDAETRYIPPDEIEKDRDQYTSPKLVFRQTAATPTGALDTESRATIKSVYNVTASESETDIVRVLGVLNSSLFEYYHEMKYAAYRSVFPQINQSTFESYPVAVPTDPEFEDLVNRRIEATRRLESLPLDLRSQLGEYRPGKPLSSVGSRQPVASPDSPLQKTTRELPQLRLGRASVSRRSAGTVLLEATARYKPPVGTGDAVADEPATETDQWGYTETDLLPAVRITRLGPREADLIEAFVPVAVDEAGGFANVRKTATKTNSLIDRLRKLTLPAVDDVRNGLDRYFEAKERAEELEAEIEKTDRRIDELVYDRYGLIEAEIEAVESTLDRMQDG
ncbi:Eco57I restriction-modification methylase domain-containing protein [Natrinema halophilum]|uniref:site-specific DNA-methyltransferase (adenine-specific) n=1 Tax=Natrinema halophilum TaxID=1699371 RepID=A0A7D5GJQ6_9EURY|nr:N-6 DNA methylase [Natrinema halophilum]QLG50787.1 N-6 DNA methylase [Natrinema halophilum]